MTVANHMGNVCPACWRGTLSGGVCTVCHYPVSAQSCRRADALPLGTVLKGRYQIGVVLGNGGFGITYSAWDQQDCRRVALKELYPRNEVFRGGDRLTVTPVSGEEVIFEELKERFEREASLLLQLRDLSNLVKVYDLFQGNGTVYYTMEYLEGADLQSYLKRNGPMSWLTLEPMMRELLPTLAQLHGKNLIHRDLSPDNLLLTTDHHLHLIDFGSVRTYQGNRNFTVHLKEHFAPWEQYTSKGRQGPWTDVYALSVTMYYLLSGKLPPKAGERMNGTPTPPLRTIAPSVPERVAAVIEHGMALRVEDRIPDAERFMQALGIADPAVVQPPPVRITGTGGSYWLQGQSGVYAGKRRPLEVETEVYFGRQVGCHICFPDQTRGVSRRQCALYVRRDGSLLVRDAGSSYGTFLNGQRLSSGWTAAKPGSVLQFGNEVFRLQTNR